MSIKGNNTIILISLIAEIRISKTKSCLLYLAKVNGQLEAIVENKGKYLWAEELSNDYFYSDIEFDISKVNVMKTYDLEVIESVTMVDNDESIVMSA